jgi:hypothetical protein
MERTLSDEFDVRRFFINQPRGFLRNPSGQFIQQENEFMQRKSLSIVVIVMLIISLITASLANAGGWSVNNWSIGSLVADGWYAGLGSGTFNISVTGTGTVSALCQNNGGNIAPGRNPVTFRVSETGSFLADENGRIDAVVAAPNPTLVNLTVSPTPKTAGCPSDSWTVVGLDTSKIDWTGANITVVNASTGAVKHNLNFTCNTTHDASGVATDVDCTHVP